MNRWLLGGLLVLLLSVGTMACGGSDQPLTLEEFFPKWEEVSNEGRQKIQALNAKYPQAFQNDVQQTKDYYLEYVEIFDETDSQFADISAPEEVLTVSDQILETEGKMSDVHHERVDQLTTVTSGDDLNVVFAPNAEYEALRDKDAELCGQMVQIAKDANISYGVVC